MKKYHLLSVILFFCVLFSLPLITILLPKQDFSEMENRKLAQFPQFSIRTIVNRNFMDGFETYIADHFVGRDVWVGIKADSEYLMGKRENNGVFIGKHSLIRRLDEPDAESVQGNIEGIIQFSKDHNLPSYIMIVPTAEAIMQNELPNYAPVWNQKQFIEEIYAALKDYAAGIDVYSTLFSHQSEYIYYRTDHHWTTLGAFYAYQEMGNRMNFNPRAMRTFDIETATEEFFGTLYSKAGYRHIEPDTIQLYHSNIEGRTYQVSIFNGEQTTEYDSMYFREFLDRKDKYSVFFGQNQPIVTVQTDDTSGRNLLIFKDSFAHSIVPLLAQNYSKITMVDLRYLNGSYLNYIDPQEYDQVLYLYNVENFSSSNDLQRLTWNQPSEKQQTSA